jgi:cell wall-associated NlpC family hydrolase
MPVNSEQLSVASQKPRLVRATVKAARPRPAAPSLASLKPAHRASVHALASSVYADLLGKPFVAGARGPDSYDCVGLAMVIAQRLGKQVPAYVSSEAELHAQLGAGGASLADCPQIPRPVPGCAVLLRISPNQHHLAFMVDESRMVHTTQATGCVIERVNSPLWQRKVIGYYSLEAAK